MAVLPPAPQRTVALTTGLRQRETSVGSPAARWWLLKIDFGSLTQVTYLIGADAIMLIAGLAACALPLRRALTINPTDALRAEA